MAQGAFEGGVVSIRGDASQVKNELLEVSKLLTELEKNKVKLKPEIDINNVKKDVNKLEQYMQGKFGALDFSQVYSKLMTQVQKNPNKFAEELAKTMRGVNLLEQAVKPEDISKLAAASAQEMFDLVQRLGGLAEGTKPTSNLVTKRLKEIYDKYPNGIEGLSGSGKGGGFGASEETLNKIGETLERIDVNVKSINDSIQTGAITVQAVAESAENVVDKTKQAADAQAELTTETEKTAQAQERLEQAQDKNNGQRQNTIDKKESGKETEKGDSKKGTDSISPPISNTKSLNDTIKKEEELKQVAEKTNETLKNQQSLKTVSYQDIMSKSISDVASNASKVLQNLNESQKELGNNIQTTTNLLETQNAQIQDTNNKPIIENTTTEINTQQIMFDAFSESAKRAGEIGQKLGQQQNLLANAFQKTTEQIAHQSMFDTFIDGAKQAGEALQQLGQQQDKLLSETFQASQKTNEEYNPKEIIERAGDIDQVQKYIYSISEAEAKLKEIKSRHVNKKDEAKQLNPLEAREVWGALNSLDQISLFGSDEEVERINQIFDQYEEWVERYVTQDPLGTNALDKISALFERMNKYRSAFDKVNTLDQSRDLYNLDIEQRSAIMTPDQTIEGYTYAIDRVQVILETMEQYKTAIEEAQSKGREITEADQKFLNDYEKTKNQWVRAGERAQRNLEPLQEQERLKEETKQRIAQEKEDEKQRRIFRQKLKRENRQARINEDQQFEADFQNYDIKNIENMDLEEIDRQISQMEERKQKALELKGEFNQLEKTIKQNNSYGESKFDDETIALMRPTDQESQWLAEYDARMAKRKEYAEALKKRKSQLNKELTKKEEEGIDTSAKDNGQKDVDQAQSNAEKAQNAADRAKKAADESEEAVKRANDAQKKLKQDTPKDTGKTSVAESVNANQTAQNNAKNVEESKEVLESNLSQLQNQVNKLQDRKKKLEKAKEQLTDTKKYDDTFFEIDAQESGKTAKKYRKDRTEEVTEELKKLEADLEKKQAELQKVQERINNINATEQQTLNSQPQTKDIKKKKSKKPKIIMPTQEQQQGAVDGQIQTQVENEKKNTDAAQQLGDQTQQTNDNLEKAKDLSDIEQQLLNSIFGNDGEKGGDNTGNGSGLQSESEAILHLIDALKDIPSATQALSQFDAVNSNIAGNAQGAADAIQAEADAVSSVTQASQSIVKGRNTIDDKDKKPSSVQETEKDAEKELEQAQTLEQQIDLKIEAIRAGLKSTEDELQEYSLEDSRFSVGKNKTKGYSQAKQFADQLKADYEALQSVDKEANPEEYKAKLDQYTKSRVLFQKAYQAMWDAGGAPASKDKPTKKNPVTPLQQLINLMKQHGAQSPDFEQALQDFERQAQEAREKFERQKAETEKIIQGLEQEKIKAGLEQKQASSQSKPTVETKPVDEKPDLGGNQTGNGVQTEGDKAADAATKMKELAAAKKEVTEANQKLAQSAQNTTGALNNEGGAGANAGKVFDPKPLQQEIDALKQVSEQQKKTIDEQKQAIDDLQKKQEEATNKKIANLQKENDAFTAQQQQDLQRYKDAELQTQMMLALQKQATEEEAKVREEQEAKAAQKAKEKAEKAAQKAQTKADDKELAQAYGNYGKDFSAVLNAKSIQEFDMAVAHLTETERIFWDARLKNMGDSYAINSNMYAQNDLPADYKKSTEAQAQGLKQRQIQIAEFTASLIAEAEKQQAAFEKMDTAYKTNTQNPTKGHLDFITSTKVDDKQAQSYMSAVDGVTESLQKLHSVAESMKNGTFDFGDINALRELFELRQTLDSQMGTLKVEDKGYKSAQSELEANANKTAEGLKKSLSGVADQIEGIQKKSKKLINPDQEYQEQLQASEQLLQVIKELIADINNNPLQFMDEGNVKGFRLLVDAMKADVSDFQDKFDSQQGIQGRINTYFTSYKGAYTSFFREIKDSFKSQALGELENEIGRTFQTFKDSITNLNRATGLNQGEFLDKYLNTNGGKATAGQIEQQQKVRNAIAESYRGLITDISDELTKVQNKMADVFGEKFFDKNYFDNFGKQFTAGLGDASEFEKFQGNAQKARDAFVELQKIQKQMADGKFDLTQLSPDELKERIKEIVELFAELNKNYQLATEKSKEFTFADAGDIEKQRAGITQFLKSNKGISSEARADLQAYFSQLQQGISQADLTKLTDGWHQVANAEQAAGRTGATFMSELQTRFRSLSAYLLSFVSFYRVIGVFKDGINIIHELDDALTEMQKVSDESLASLKEYQKTTFATANDIGTTAAQLQQSTADWMRLGEDLQQASQSAQTANVLFNVSEFDNIDDATTALVAMSAAYEDAEKGIDKMDIVDRLNLIGNNYAIATDELATALQDGAATLTTAGNDLDEAIALTTAGNEKIA